MEKTLLDKVFRNDAGEIVLAQPPNLPLIAWGVCTGLKLLFPTGQPALGLDAIAFGSLFTWAWLELFQGVNYFRRFLGLLVFCGLIWAKVQMPID
jgi:hypothetical protein